MFLFGGVLLSCLAGNYAENTKSKVLYTHKVSCNAFWYWIGGLIRKGTQIPKDVARFNFL